MEIVVKISKRGYEVLKKFAGMGDPIHKAVMEGKVLPKGHGRLIDADKLNTHFVGTELGTDLEVYLKPTITNALTVIEADKEVDE